jgi:hypothetical protein
MRTPHCTPPPPPPTTSQQGPTFSAKPSTRPFTRAVVNGNVTGVLPGLTCTPTTGTPSQRTHVPSTIPHKHWRRGGVVHADTDTYTRQPRVGADEHAHHTHSSSTLHPPLDAAKPPPHLFVASPQPVLQIGHDPRPVPGPAAPLLAAAKVHALHRAVNAGVVACLRVAVVEAAAEVRGGGRGMVWGADRA